MDYFQNGHLKEVSRDCENGAEYFLPHHAVIKNSSSTTKVRVVFDGSCKTADGASLNDILLTGPKLQTDIRDIFFNWRFYQFVFTADIAKMYRMFWIADHHHNYQKILWRFDKSEEIKEFSLTTVTFGTSSAPFQAIRCLHYIAEQETVSFPSISKSILRDFYVDDYISGAHSVESAITKQKDLRQIFQSYGLILRKWNSNRLDILEGIEEEHRETLTELRFEEGEFRKTLGVFWAPKDDYFSFSTYQYEIPDYNFTKRNILSLIARLYDPLGWVGPCTLFAKIIMQRVWEQNIGWDDEVCFSIKKDFQEFLKDLPKLSNLKLKRWLNTTDDHSPLTLYGFSDASLKGYGAVLYLLNPQDCNQLILLASKTRVKPLKHITLARLELCAAVMLADLLKWAIALLEPRQVKVSAFTDSKIVLSWLQSHPSRWKMYVASRTSKILETLTSDQWFYINTKSNPADYASRGLLPSQLVNNSLWWNGPHLDNLNTTNVVGNLSEEDKTTFLTETKALHTLASNQDTISQLLDKYSSHGKLCGVISCLLKFISKTLLKLSLKNTKFLENHATFLSICRKPELIIVRLVQSRFYKKEIVALTNKQNLPHKSSLLSLNPFIDGFGVLRVGGRLQNSCLSYNQKHPIILPSNHQVTNNLISLAHHATLHGQKTITAAYLRHKFHIIKGGDRIKYLLKRCPTCIRYAKENHEQLMGSLPGDRVNPHRPFLNCGVDYAGPFTLKAYGGRCKKYLKFYVALFVCFATKAVHLELVSDLTSSAFLAAFKRFVNRRGLCQNLYSDRGTNFVKGDKMLTQEIHLAQLTWKSELEHEFETMDTKWHFNPPGAPHFGGLWEGGVKAMKSHLYKVMGKALFTSEEFNTLLIQIEGILNSRPLCPLNENPNNFVFLTPAHFLIGESLVTPPERAYNCSDNKHPVDRWQYIQKMRQCFWNSWKNDYLHYLNVRSKWRIPGIHYKKGDLVLLMDENVPPAHWPKAIILEIHPGKDKQTRVLTLQTEKGKIFQRPTAKVRFLPIRDI